MLWIGFYVGLVLRWHFLGIKMLQWNKSLRSFMSNFGSFLIPLPTPSWSFPYKQFYWRVTSRKEAKFEYPLSNFGSFSYFQTFRSLGVEQGLQKLPKLDINDLKLVFHCYILIHRKCQHKTPFRTQCPPRIFRPSYGPVIAECRCSYWCNSIKKWSNFTFCDVTKNFIKASLFQRIYNLYSGSGRVQWIKKNQNSALK